MSEAARKDSDVELLLEFERRIRDLERNTLNSSKSAQRWHEVGDVNDPLAVPFGANIQNVGAFWPHAAYYKDGTGMVHLRGNVRQIAVGAGNIICVLPEGFKPAVLEVVLSKASQSVAPVEQIATIQLSIDGSVQMGNPPGAGGKWDLFGMFNVHFYAA